MHEGRHLAPVFWMTASIVLLAASCASEVPTVLEATQQPPELAPTATSKAVSTPTPRPTLTSQPTRPPTQTPTPTPDVPPPALSDTLLTNDFFFGPGSVPGCELPCWQGLVVGESGRAEIQAMYDTVLGFNGTRQFILDNPDQSSRIWLPDEYWGGGYLWFGLPGDPATEGSENFAVSFVYEMETFRLVELKFRSSVPRFNASLSPQRVIRELGEPSHLIIAVRGGERGDRLGLSLELLYVDGYVFQFSEAFIPTDPNDDAVEVCLGHSYWQAGGYDVGGITIRIFEPFGESLGNLPPLVKAELRFLESDAFIPITDYFDVSLEDITELALQDEDACLFKDFSE
jgi:hypothetical protein